MRFSDRTNGIRGTKFFNAVPAACFPCGTALGSTFDTDLMFEAGKLMGLEARCKGVHAILGPTVNMQRSPLGGRGFESFSEDPVLAGLTAAALINGIQSEGVVATIKHFVANDQEHERRRVSSVVSDRALREIYLLPFQLAVKNSQPGAFMTSYNKVNGVHVSDSPKFLKDILREEWAWNGLVMSDWYGIYSTAASINAGVDVEMPGPTAFRGKLISTAINAGTVTLSTLDKRVRAVLELVNRAYATGIPERATETGNDTQETSNLLRKLAADSIVLLKNENNILPFSKTKTVSS